MSKYSQNSHNLYSSKNYYLLFFLSLLLNITSTSQNLSKSYKDKSFSEIKGNLLSVKNDSFKAIIHAKAYLLKAKDENDTLNIAKGYHYLYFSTGNEKIKEIYLDSIISLTNNKKLKNYPISAYYLKGQKLYTQRLFDAALFNFLEVRKINNLRFFEKEVEIEMDYYIGLIKSRIGDYDGALSLFNNNYNYYANKKDDKKILMSLYAIADTYRHIKDLDSSSYYNLKGINKSLLNKDRIWYNYFLLNEGASLHDKERYQSSLDSLNKCLPIIIKTDDNPNIAMAYYFLGSNYYSLNNKPIALSYLKKVDSLYIKTNDIHPELRRTYELLIKESILNKNFKEELLYVKKLLKVDVKLNKNYKKLSRKIVKEFDTPNLLKKKEDLIANLKKESSNYFNLGIIISVCLLILFLYFIYYSKKQKIYKQRLEELIEKQTKNTKTTYNIIPQPKKETKKISISDENINEILKSLENFEKINGFLDSKVSINHLAKKINTNTKYLSRVINHYKNKNFTNYLNDLRVDYAVNKLTNDLSFRKFTIVAIANEVGFNNAESFSNAFYKKTGIKPSYFIKNIN